MRGAGGGVQFGGEEHWLTGELVPGELSIAEQIERSGAPELLLDRYAGRLEYHEPWHVAREVSHLFRGLVDAEEVDLLLAEHGYEHLRLVDNGVVNRRSRALAELPHVRGYHLVPASASKAAAVALHQRARGYAREETFAVGRLARGLACARPRRHVLAGRRTRSTRDPSIREAMAAYENVRVAESGHGAGVYEAVVSTLMDARLNDGLDDALALLLLVEALDDELLEQRLIARVARGGEGLQPHERELVEADRDRRRAARADDVLHAQGPFASLLGFEELVGVGREAFGRVYVGGAWHVRVLLCVVERRGAGWGGEVFDLKFCATIVIDIYERYTARPKSTTD